MNSKLGFNIDHIATLRNARGEGYPNLLQAAEIAIKAGAQQITAHLREDRRHIKDVDIYNLKNNIPTDLNMEIAPTDEMIRIAIDVKPHSVCLVPERREELTTEGGLDIIKKFCNLVEKIEKLKNENIKVILFLDAKDNQINKALTLPIDGVEFNTGRYANIKNNLQNKEADKIREMANLITDKGLEAHAGHGLNFENIKTIAKIMCINEFNIGHFLVAESIFMGLEGSIRKMIELINNARM